MEVIDAKTTEIPEKLRGAVVELMTAKKRCQHAEKQEGLWIRERKLATRAREAAYEEYDALLKKWNPLTGEIEEPQEMKK